MCMYLAVVADKKKQKENGVSETNTKYGQACCVPFYTNALGKVTKTVSYFSHSIYVSK